MMKRSRRLTAAPKPVNFSRRIRQKISLASDCLVCGLDGIYALGMQAIDDAAFIRYLKHYIALELPQA